MVMRPPFLLSPRRSPWSKLLDTPFGSVVYYPGEPGSGATITDYSAIGSNDGALTNVTWGQLSSGLRTLVFDGDSGDYVKKASPTGLSGNTACTFKIWVNLGELDSRQAFMSFGKQAAHEAIFFEIQSDNAWRFHFWDQGLVSTAIPTAALGVWVQVVGVYDKTNNYIYTNGVQRDDTAYSTADLGTDNFYLGDYTASGLPTQGQIALVEIDSWAWDVGKVADSFNSERQFFGV